MDESQEHAAYAVHLRAEHRRLDEVLLRVRRDWPAFDGATPSPAAIKQTAEVLLKLREELSNHFREEEEGGCLEEAVCRCPSLGHEADRIEHEHVQLLTELDEIIAHLKFPRQSVHTLDNLLAKFEQLAEKLHAHEAAENMLLEGAFGIPVD